MTCSARETPVGAAAYSAARAKGDEWAEEEEEEERMLWRGEGRGFTRQVVVVVVDASVGGDSVKGTVAVLAGQHSPRIQVLKTRFPMARCLGGYGHGRARDRDRDRDFC